MAKIKTVLFSEISGKAGTVDFRTLRGSGIDFGKHRIPLNPKSTKQRIHRRKYGEAVQAWRALSNDDKELWNKEAKDLKLSGYNLYIMSKLTPPEVYSAAGTTDTNIETAEWTDLPQLSLVFESNATRLLVAGTMNVYSNTDYENAAMVGITVDGTLKVATRSYIEPRKRACLALQELVTVTPGEHTIKMRWQAPIEDLIKNRPTLQPDSEHRTLSVIAFA